jgi:hypothetical protein
MENRGLIPHMIPIILLLLLLHLKVSGNIIFTIIPNKISIATVVIFLFLFFSVPEDAD